MLTYVYVRSALKEGFRGYFAKKTLFNNLEECLIVNGSRIGKLKMFVDGFFQFFAAMTSVCNNFYLGII